MKFWKNSASKRLAGVLIFLLFSLSAQEGVAEKITLENRGGDFTLIAAEGPLSLQDLRGKVVLLFFGFTACPSVCPVSLVTISRAFAKLSPDELAQVTALFISLDPERDTPEMLKQYTGYFHSNIIGLTERPEHIAQIAEKYGVKHEKKELLDSALGYVISHSADIYVVDPQGKLCASFPHDTDLEPLLVQIKRLLNSKS
jgi:protein SCO1/2